MTFVPALTKKMVKGTGGPAGDECQNLVADPITANEGRTYTHEGKNNFRTHNVVFPGVRRLTTTECERLQGLPDNWTDPPGVLKTSDSKRYAGLGDAVTANVAEWICRRLLEKDTPA